MSNIPQLTSQATSQNSPQSADDNAITPLLAIIHRTANLLQQNQNTEHTHPFKGLIILDDNFLQVAEFKQNFSNFSNEWQIISLSDFILLEFCHYYDLAVMVFANSADNLSKITTTMRSTVQRCRDLFAQHSLIFAPVGQDFIAFGFHKIGEENLLLAEKAYQGWQFNLFDYKQLPDWFNSRFWANPENWNKFHW